MNYLVANWKMYVGPVQGQVLAKAYAGLRIPEGVQAIVAPTALELVGVKECLMETGWQVAAQDVAWEIEGAYTGAISAPMFAAAGATYTLIGHSERRHIFGESDSEIAKKIPAAVSAGLTPILCIGESAEDLADGKRQYRLKKQLQVLTQLEPGNPLIIAYEPVWAIGGSGTGQHCLPADVEDVHGFIKTELALLGFVDTPILYGGSVNATNAADYVAVPHVDGLLIGTVSVHPEEVQKILDLLG